MTLHKYVYANDNPVSFIDPTGLSILFDYNPSSLAATGLIAAILLVSYELSRQIGGFSTREDIDDFIDAYTYFAKKADKPSEGEAQKDTGGDGAEDSLQRHGGGKNAQHGKAENLPSHERQLKGLEDQLKDAVGRKEKVQISNKIKRLKQEMQDRKTGENHSRRAKK